MSVGAFLDDGIGYFRKYIYLNLFGHELCFSFDAIMVRSPLEVFEEAGVVLSTVLSRIVCCELL